MDTVLLIEEHNETGYWLADIIQSAFVGIEITEAKTLGQAREHLDKQQYNLVIIDIDLMNGCGIDFIRSITRSKPETNCVVTTVFSDKQHIFAAFRAGAKGYLLKEQPKIELVERLKGITNGDMAISPAIIRSITEGIFGDCCCIQKKTGLSPREQEVLTLYAKGMSRVDIAALLGITSSTVAGYLKNIYNKLDINSSAEAALAAVKLGLVNVIRDY